MRLGLLHEGLRAEEKMLLEAARARDHEPVPLDLREAAFSTHQAPDLGVDAVLLRVPGYHRALSAAQALDRHGVPAVNGPGTIRVCGDKVEASLRLAEAGVPTPETRLAYDLEGAAEALEALGGEAVVKPPVGSWGRLLARVDDGETLRTLVDHKTTLGGPRHDVLYLQEVVEKGGRDVRAFVAGGQVLCAIERENPDDWITNTARGAEARDREVTPDLEEICLRAAEAVGGGALALDLMPRPDGTWTCHEVNHAMEFRNSVDPTGVDIPGRVVEHLAREAKAR